MTATWLRGYTATRHRRTGVSGLGADYWRVWQPPPSRRRIVAARCVQLLVLASVPVWLAVSASATGIGAVLAWERLAADPGGVARCVEGAFSVLLTLGGLAALAATLWLAGPGVRRVGAHIARAPLAKMTGGVGGSLSRGGFFDTRR